ncbi:MAG: xylulose kinase [Proteobacteria bacterium]|nr:xylulose kinase [Pseudomonadota bacterium]
MLKEKYILTVDLGTSGPKTALISTRGNVLGHEFQETELILLPGGGAEQNPDDWWDAIMATAKRLLSRDLVPVDDIVAVSVTTQWSGTVAVDRDGNHLMNAIIWMDTRGGKYIDQVLDGIIKIEGYSVRKLLKWIKITGGCPGHHGKDPTAHILYIKNEHPKIYEKTYMFLEPKDYINFRLTGQYAAGFDSIILHWVTDNRDIENVKYSNSLLKITGIEREKLPDLKQSTDILGPLSKKVAEDLGLKQDVKVIMGMPDVQSASIGSGAVEDYEGHIYLGTSSWITCHVPFKKTDIFHQIASLPSAIPGRYLLTNEQENAGSCLTYLRDNILFHKDELLEGEGRPDVYNTFNKMVEGTPAGSDKVIFMPYLYGERAPVDDHTVRAAFFNQSLTTTRRHLIRAVYEGVAYNSKWLLKYVEKFIGRKMKAINLIGGGANSDIWCQIFADVLDRKIRQVKDPIHAGVRGAAFLASAALGYIAFDDIPAIIEIEKTYEPNEKNRKIYDELFAEFLNLYKANHKIHMRLNSH